MSGCIFCQIVARERPAAVLHEDDRCIAIEDVNPKSPVHVLVIPRKHIPSLTDSAADDEGLLGHLLLVAARVAKDKGIIGSGFRTVINTNAGAGQTIFHLHLHVMGGRLMRWPPG
ncbi:MAG: histidine triad nucleotide-binding protein [Acidobacteriia bacterium]|nr:histidine triad nucleotide-binding protein [Terriglobia bacterium]